MSFDTEFISNNAAPALLAINMPEWLARSRAILTQCGYKARAASNHEDFYSRLTRTRYEVVVIEESFSSDSIVDNVSLYRVQQMAMQDRRGTTIIILGNSFETLNPRLAYQQSVHAVLNPDDLESLGPVVQQAVTNNGLFNEIFFAAEQRLMNGSAIPA